MSNNSVIIEGEEVQVVETQESALALTENFLTNVIASSKNLNNAEVAITITAEYLDFTLNKPFRGTLIGFIPMRFKSKTRPGEYDNMDGVRFMDVNQEVKISSAVALVNEIKKGGITPGTSLEITNTGKDGNTLLFKISLLANIAKA